MRCPTMKAGALLVLLSLITPWARTQNGAAPSSSAPATTQSEAAQFLFRAAKQVLQYRQDFRDLTSDETREIDIYDGRGRLMQKTLTRASLFIYRSQSNPKLVTEYRDVYEVDGKEVKNHQKRAIEMWQKLSQTKDAADELRHINEESGRYTPQVTLEGFTLNEGLPLNFACAGDFTFRQAGIEQVSGREARVFEYWQTNPCAVVNYRFNMPAYLESLPKMHRGKIWLDTETAEILREIRDAYVEYSPSTNKTYTISIAHFEFEYAPSSFGLMLPVSILAEARNFGSRMGAAFVPPVGNRVRQTYTPFSKFEVTVQEHAGAVAAH